MSVRQLIDSRLRSLHSLEESQDELRKVIENLRKATRDLEALSDKASNNFFKRKLLEPIKSIDLTTEILDMVADDDFSFKE